MNKKLETITTEHLDTTTGGNWRGDEARGFGFSPRWAVNHPYRAQAFLENHPRYAAHWTENHPYATARLGRITGY